MASSGADRPGVRAAEPAWTLAPADIENSASFQAGLPALAARCGRTVESVLREARSYLQELHTAHVPWVYARVVAAGRRLVASGYERVDYDLAEVERLRALFGRWPAVVLSSHRSYLDGGALTVGFADHGLPSLTVFAGANMAFWPIGPLWRRANAVFIRRAGTTPVYGYALRHCVAGLVARRRPLQWFLEGTRSRSGLLGAPKLGLLGYVVDAWREGRADDVMLVPASIAYDQLREVEEYADAALGRPKQRETLGWLVRFVRAQRGRHGAIHVRFGEPVSLRQALGPPADLPPSGTPAARAALDALALEVARRIEAATPITGAALLGVALLAARGRALTERELVTALRGYLAYARARGVPLTRSANLDDAAARAAALGALCEHGVVDVLGAGALAEYRVAAGRELRVAYYRNSIVHHFVPAAVAELAVCEAAATSTGPEAVAVERAFSLAVGALHELLATDFHLVDAARFARRVRDDLEGWAPDWRERVGEGRDGVLALLGRAPVLCSDLMLRPLFEAHAVVADWVGQRDATALPEDSIALAQCLKAGQGWLARGRLMHPEAVALPLLAAALRHARQSPAAGPVQRWLPLLDEVHRIAVRRVQAEVRVGDAAGPAQGSAVGTP